MWRNIRSPLRPYADFFLSSSSIAVNSASTTFSFSCSATAFSVACKTASARFLAATVFLALSSMAWCPIWFRYILAPDRRPVANRDSHTL